MTKRGGPSVLKFDIHCRLVAVFGSDPRLRAWFSASETVAGVRTRNDFALSANQRERVTDTSGAGKRLLLIGKSGDLRQGPTGHDRCGFPHPSRCLKVRTETRALLEVILGLGRQSILSERCAWDTQPWVLVCPSWPPTRIGRIGWFVAIQGAYVARRPDFLPRSLKFSCRRPARIILSTVDSHEVARTFP